MKDHSGDSQIGNDGPAFLGTPPEVFLSISKFVLELDSKYPTKAFPNPGTLRYYLALASLRLVCRSWDKLLQTSPLFWTLLHSQHPTRTWDLVLLRSHPLPLAVVLLPDCAHQDRVTFLRLIAIHMDRIRSMSLEIPKRVQDLDLSPIISSPAPRLEIFVVDVPPTACNFHLSSLFRGVAPLLRAVSITGNIPDESLEVPALANGRLEALIIDNLNRGAQNLDLSSIHLARLDFIPGLLRSSPRLKCLVLRWCTISDSIDSTIRHETETLHLPDLSRLELSVTEPLLLGFVFKNIRAPNCVDTKVLTWSSFPEQFPEHLESSIAEHMATTIRMANLDHKLTLVFLDDGSVTVNGALVYDVQGDFPLADIATLGRIFSLLSNDVLERVTTIAISSSQWKKLSDGFVLRIIPVFQEVSELILQTSTYGLDLEALQGGLWTLEGTEEEVLPCPRLQRIRLSSSTVSYDDAWALSNFIRKRNQFKQQYGPEEFTTRIQSVHLPLHRDPEAISAMFEGEKVTVEFENQPEMFARSGKEEIFEAYD